MNFVPGHVSHLICTIPDVYEIPMKFQSEFCKIYFKKVSNITPTK